MDPVNEAEQLRESGEFEKALEKHLWIHDHSLEANPGYYGVRLSFALAERVKLGKQYPKALEKLKEIRGEKSLRLLAGETDRALFHDVMAIDRSLGDRQKTVELFKRIQTGNSQFAAEVYDIAEAALVQANEYALAKKYMGNPKTRFLTAKGNFERGIKVANKSRSRQEAFERIFTDSVVRIMTVLDKTGDGTLAREIQSDALAVLDSPIIKDALKN
jgi:tetratricopeptide (TPR) repeat protein